MKEDFLVAEITSEKIIVSSNSSKIEVINPKKFPIREGSIVHIGFSKKLEGIQSIGIICSSLIAGALGIIIAPYISNLLKIQCTEITKFIFAAALYLTVAFITKYITRKTHIIIKPRIIEIVE